MLISPLYFTPHLVQNDNSIFRLPDELITRIIIYSQEYNAFKVCKRFRQYITSLEFKALFLGLGSNHFKNVFTEQTVKHPWFDEGLAIVLLRLGGNIQYDNHRIVQWACTNSIQVLKFIIDKYSIDFTLNDGLLFRLACLNDNIEAVRLLIKEGVDVAQVGNVSFLEAAARNKTELVKLLLDNGTDVHFNNDYALREASRAGQLDLLHVLLHHGANVHAFNESALLTACHKGHADIVSVLIDHGVNINFNCGSALRFSASQGHLKVVSLLLHKGIDTNAFQCGAKALRDSSRNGYFDVVRELVQYGISSSSLNCSALLCAILNDHFLVARFLLQHGATPDFKSLEFKRYHSNFQQKDVGMLLQEFNIQV
ncbi:hypothetical protein DSO57_1014443 [Entomophthora muscae]|nr:hypothetical protein DSO57_1014443 [Entomophthora muscae]